MCVLTQNKRVYTLLFTLVLIEVRNNVTFKLDYRDYPRNKNERIQTVICDTYFAFFLFLS